MSLPTEITVAQSGAYNYIAGVGAKHWWGRHLIGPAKLGQLLEDSATLDRIRAHFQHGADEEAWPPGTPLEVAVRRLVAERNELRARVAQIPPMTGDRT